MIQNSDYANGLATITDAVKKARARFGLGLRFSIAVSEDVAEAFEEYVESQRQPFVLKRQPGAPDVAVEEPHAKRKLYLNGIRVWRLVGAEKRTCLVCAHPDDLCGRPIFPPEQPT